MATKVFNKTILQTSFTSLESIYYLLQTVKDNQPMLSSAGKDTIFPQARAKISQARGGEWSEDKRDTHAELTLSEMRFIRYIDEQDSIFEVSDIGNEFLNSFKLIKKPTEDGKFILSLEDELSIDDRNQLLFDILTGIRVVQPKYGRKIHPYKILFKLLIEKSFNGYISKSEWASFINDSAFLTDNQYDEIKNRILCVRRTGENVEPQKSDRILTRLVLWNVLNRLNSNNLFCLNDNFVSTIKNNFYFSGEMQTRIIIPNSDNFEKEPRQKITYGAPGTGKSHSISIDTKDQTVIRTTFHPDSDYSTFVGAYKPTMEFVETRVVPVIVDTGLTFDKNNGTYKEKKITYKFVKQAFLKAYLGAWKKYTEPKTDDEGKEVILPQFLVIEEINRGNCAQIFGDLFQLLDRQDNKFSSYPIEADADLQQEIANAFKNDPLYKLSNNIDVEGIIEDYTSNYTDENGKPCTLSDDIQSGRVLLLPKNLYIWATMNTSDQSLFPIDSAFKRRWDWEYVRISEGRDKQNNNEPLRWYIAIKEEQYDWWSFLNKINERIGSITSSEDKKLGYFFCKADDGKISAEKFVSKVCFYLWNDVFKDFGFGKKDQSAAFKKENGKDIAFDDFYTEDPETFKSKVNEDLLENFMQKLEVDTVAKRLEKENKAAENNNNAPQQNEVPTE